MVWGRLNIKEHQQNILEYPRRGPKNRSFPVGRPKEIHTNRAATYSRRKGDESTCGSLCRSCFRGDQNQKMGLCPFKVPFQPDPGDADLSRLQRGYQNWQIHLVVLTPQRTSKGSPVFIPRSRSSEGIRAAGESAFSFPAGEF